MVEPYTITYSGHFKVNDKTFAFRLKELFDITNIPIHLPIKDNNGSKGYWIDRKWYSLSKIKEMYVNNPITVDVSDLQWYQQEQLNNVFNL